MKPRPNPPVVAPGETRAATPVRVPASGPHPRNRHRGRYDFAALTARCPELAGDLAPNAHGDLSLDFANPEAVKRLNRALLAHHYGVVGWDIPPGFLCPPIPGRADYIHGLADLLAADRGGVVPRGPAVRLLDLGTGANLVYPLVGHGEYGWSFVGTDIDDLALASARRILAANPTQAGAVTLRRQTTADRLFAGVTGADERFAVSLCNPPFHASAREAAAGSVRKWRNLGRAASGGAGAPALNFGGRAAELWCPGGECGFLRRMIAESAASPGRCGWFTALVARSEHLPALTRALAGAHAAEVRIVEMAQGAKKSRFLAWSFLTPAARAGIV